MKINNYPYDEYGLMKGVVKSRFPHYQQAEMQMVM